MSTKRSAFTLIELLIVIVIIALLAGLLLTAVSAGMRMAKRTQANAEVKAIATALECYYSEYHKWPQTTVPDPEADPVRINGNIARVLQGEDVPAGQKNNLKKIVFMQFKTFANGDTGQPVSPWWRTGTVSNDHRYSYKLDNNFDNVIDGTGDAASPPSTTVRRRVLVWTKNLDNGSFIMSSD